MNSRAAVLSRHLPRVCRVPQATSSDGDDAGFLSSAYGLIPDEWQEDVLEAWMGRRKDGRWAAATCGLAVPRQNGKNGAIEMRELFGMVALGERFLHTAHEVKTARKAFLRIASFFENERKFPELAALVKTIRKTNGQEAVLLNNGGSVEFIARSRGSGRGFTVDVLVCDEAQELSDEELSALLPTISAAPLRNPQVILTGTPPDPDKPRGGQVWRRIRSDGELGKDRRLSWIDYGVPDGPMPDVDDRELWAAVNPTLGKRLDVAEIVRERGLMTPEAFARERLGWWGDPEAAASSVISVSSWARLARPTAEQPKAATVAIDVSPNRGSSSIGIAAEGIDGRTLVLVRTQPGTAWLVPALSKLIEHREILEVALYPNSQAGALIPDLIAADIDYVALTQREMGNACAAFQTAVTEGTVEHVGQPELDAAIANAKTRYVGETELYDRRDRSIDISPLVSVSAAAFRWAMQSDYDPLDSIF